MQSKADFSSLPLLHPMQATGGLDSNTDRVREYAKTKQAERIRLKNAFAQAFEDAGYSDVAGKLRDCTEQEALAICPNCGHLRYVVIRCRSRICPVCSFREARKRAKALAALTMECPHPKLITLTMPAWRDDPGDGIAYLQRCFTALRRRALWKAVRGGAYTIELVMHDGYWHIHMHIFADADYLPYQKLFSVWRDILGESIVQIDVRSAADEKARRYVAKYASKDSMDWLTDGTIVEWWKAVKGKRLWSTFGAWYRLDLDELAADPQHKFEPTPCEQCGSIKAAIPVSLASIFFGADIMYTIQGHINSLPAKRPRVTTGAG